MAKKKYRRVTVFGPDTDLFAHKWTVHFGDNGGAFNRQHRSFGSQSHAMKFAKGISKKKKVKYIEH